MDEIKNTAVKKRKKKRSTNPAVRVLKILGTALLSIFLILIITCSIFATVLTIYVLNFADTTTTISLDKTETSNISRFLSVNPDYDEDDEDSQEYDLYYALKNSNKHVVWADLEDIPQYVQDAFVYTEDERFYSHDGVDFKRTFASFVNVFIPIYGGRQIGGRHDPVRYHPVHAPVQRALRRHRDDRAARAPHIRAHGAQKVL